MSQLATKPNATDGQAERAHARIVSAPDARHDSRARYQVRLALPGPSFQFGAVQGAVEASEKHEVGLINSGRGWDDMNFLFVSALNAAEAGECTHFAMLHSDIIPQAGWLDILLAELDRNRGDMISVAVPIKDMRGLSTCGIGDFNDPWSPFRRYTIREILAMPETFSISETEHPYHYLLHNTGCWAADLRNPLWRATNAAGELICTLNFPLRVVRGADGQWVHQRESEDWYFSRMMHGIGLRSLSTRAVKLHHEGGMQFSNSEPWGRFKNGDEDTAAKWRPVPNNE